MTFYGMQAKLSPLLSPPPPPSPRACTHHPPATTTTTVMPPNRRRLEGDRPTIPDDPSLDNGLALFHMSMHSDREACDGRVKKSEYLAHDPRFRYTTPVFFFWYGQGRASTTRDATGGNPGPDYGGALVRGMVHGAGHRYPSLLVQSGGVYPLCPGTVYHPLKGVPLYSRPKPVPVPMRGVKIAYNNTKQGVWGTRSPWFCPIKNELNLSHGNGLALWYRVWWGTL